LPISIPIDTNFVSIDTAIAAIAAIDTANWIWRNFVRNHSRPWWMECVVPLLPWSSSQGPVQCGIWTYHMLNGINDAKKWHINAYHASYHASSYGMQCSSLAFGGCGYGGHS
jgi:hypothetical protein